MEPYQRLHRMELERRTTANSLALSVTATHLATGTEDCYVEVWSCDSGRLLHRMEVSHPGTALAWDQHNPFRLFIGLKCGLTLFCDNFAVRTSPMTPE